MTVMTIPDRQNLVHDSRGSKSPVVKDGDAAVPFVGDGRGCSQHCGPGSIAENQK